jgi:hypothetical protein
MMELWVEMQSIWEAGGLLMWALLFIALLIYTTAFDLLVYLGGLKDVDTVEFEYDHMPYVKRRTQFLKILVGSAPLIGLLGTVMGMLTTFAGLGASQGGDSIDLVALGISEALITTETGLLIAIPALFMLMMINNRQLELVVDFTRTRELTLPTQKTARMS